ncbi:unnamed protein product [Cylicocyclus nassatus]|uniref:aECM cysteine-cradle domain-containing protein n=1 Tax=Cylicocyclus nassatus TaxID=53992 RepID=A0AA36GGV9_CYLNA|nr:unnamed protein product [Cylicocyclus nassatus]
MRWIALLLLAAVGRAAEEEHYIDVKQIVKGTVEAIAKLPMAQNDSEANREKNPDEFYKLFQLPADIMTKLAADAGYIEHPQTTTSAPWIVRRKVHRSSEEDSAFTQNSDEEEEEKPRKKKKYHKKKDPTLIAISDLLPKLDTTSQMPVAPLQQGLGATSMSNPVHLRTLPIVQSDTGLSQTNVQPQYAYQPIVQPDGKTYYQQVLILPGRVVSSKDSLPSQPSVESSPFIQEKPRNVVQAAYSVEAPTFPPPVEVYRRSPIPTTTPALFSQSTTTKRLYPPRFITPISNAQFQQDILGTQIPQSDPIAITSSQQPLSSTSSTNGDYPTTKIFKTYLPSEEEQRRTARVFADEAAVPPRLALKATQASPLRIRTIETATAAEMDQIRTLTRGEELREVMEQRREEVESQPRKRKLRKMRKSRKPSKKSKSMDQDSIEIRSREKTSEEYEKSQTKAPETKFLERVPVLTLPAIRKHERVFASKTWKKRKYEPVDTYVSKELQSFEEKTPVDEDTTEPPKKKRKTRRSGKTKKPLRVYTQNDDVGVKQEDTTEINYRQEPQQAEPVTSAPLKRKTLRLRRFRERTESSRARSEERSGESRPVRTKKLKRSKRVKKAKSSRNSMSWNDSNLPHRQHCLNIRTFARQFGINDVDEFSRDHCAFIENYYPQLTCERRQEYVAECQKYY